MVFYGVCFLVRLFAGADSVSFLASASLISIGFSILVAGIAAMNLALDFDFIERGSKMGLDKGFEWYGAFALLVTIIWLYMNTVQSGLKALKDSAIQQPGVVMAGTIIAAVPIVIALLLFQKALIRGLASGAVKG